VGFLLLEGRMARLITIDDIKAIGVNWYFPEYTRDSQLKLPAGDFQFVQGINNEVFRDNISLRSTIRKFVEASLSEDLIINVTHTSYNHYYSTNKPRYDWDHHSVSWGFHEFYFQNEADMILFKMQFSEYITKITPYDPDQPPSDIQEADHCKKEAEEHYLKYIDELKEAKVEYLDEKKKVIKTKIREFDEEVIEHLEKRIFRESDLDDELELLDEKGRTFVCKSIQQSLVWMKRKIAAEDRIKRVNDKYKF
jgi:hypothetical protein